ncbi:MAG: hypothetical protein ACR2I5_02230, partial [Candidatus Limnocylindria bacterium]
GMDWQLIKRPAVAVAYAANVLVRARRGIRGRKHHEGTAREIIRACIDDCWDGTHYRASPGHFRQFWTRDLSFSAPSLVRLSPQHRERVLASFDWALRTWQRRNSHVTTTIHRFDQPVDVFDYGVDCLPLMVAALHRIGADEVLESHRSWLEGEVNHYMDEVVDPATGMVRSDRKYSAHRDTIVNRCNAFGNSMVALLAMTLVDLGWDLPIPMQPLALAPQSILLDHFWDERGFFIDMPGDDTPSGEGNIWPFWTGVISDPSVLRTALTTLEERGFANPYPLKYETERRPELEPWFVRTLMPDYQGATVWTSLGSMYLQLLHTIDPGQARLEMDRYVSWIERDGTFWEVIDDETGQRYSSTFLTRSDESMLWSSIFLDLLEHPDLPSPTMRAAAGVDLVS